MCVHFGHACVCLAVLSQRRHSDDRCFLTSRPPPYCLPLCRYLQVVPDSAAMVNLKACNKFKLYGGEVALRELRVLEDLQRSARPEESDVVMHNKVLIPPFSHWMRPLLVTDDKVSVAV